MDKNKLAELFLSGKPQSEIAAKLAVSQATISRTIKQLGLTRQPIWSKVTDNIILDTRERTCEDVAKHYGISTQSIWERRKKLNLNKRLSERIDLIAAKTRKNNGDYSHFEHIDKIGSYWLGFIFADGCVRSHNGVGSNTLSIQLKNSDIGHLEKFCDDFKLSRHMIKSNRKACRVIVHDINLGRILKNLGLDREKKYKLEIPKDARNIDFLRGFWDGDGSLGFNNGRIRNGRRSKGYHTISVSLENISLAYDIKSLIYDTTNVYIGGPYKTKSIYACRSSYNKAKQIASKLYETPERYLDRKYMIYSTYFNL